MSAVPPSSSWPTLGREIALTTCSMICVSIAMIKWSRPSHNDLPLTSARAHSINLITEDFLAGYMQDGRMSVVRRFFCLFVTFDLVFVSLLWLICIVVGDGGIPMRLRCYLPCISVPRSMETIYSLPSTNKSWSTPSTNRSLMLWQSLSADFWCLYFSTPYCTSITGPS